MTILPISRGRSLATRIRPFAACGLVALTLLFNGVTARAQTAAPPARPNITAKQIARNLSLITGVAISPLLGVSVVGATNIFTR